MLFGLEVIFGLALLLVVGGVSVGLTLHLQARAIERFLDLLRARLGPGEPLLGDVQAPVAFRVEGARVAHVRRGQIDLWHLEVFDDQIACAPLSLVERGWRAPDGARMPSVSELDALELQADDAAAARASVASVGAQLAALVAGHAHVCRVSAGRVLLEIDRTRYDVDEVLAGLRRAQLVALLFGARANRLTIFAPSTHLAAPDGAPLLVPALLRPSPG